MRLARVRLRDLASARSRSARVIRNWWWRRQQRPPKESYWAWRIRPRSIAEFNSQDAGQTWRYASVKDGSSVVSPGSVTSVVYNAAAGKFFAAVRYHGIYSSSDGINWGRLADGNQPGSGLSTGNCPAVTASPSSCPIYRA